jgi:hypothetical protein
MEVAGSRSIYGGMSAAERVRYDVADKTSKYNQFILLKQLGDY